MLRWRSQGKGWIFQQERSKKVNKRAISDIHLELQGKTLKKIWGLGSSIGAGPRLLGLGHKYGIHCPPQMAFEVSSLGAPGVGGWMEGGRARERFRWLVEEEKLEKARWTEGLGDESSTCPLNAPGWL